MIFKLEKKAKNGKHMENQKAKLQNWKKNGSKINGEKKERQKGEKMEKWICPFALVLHLFCFFDLLFCFYFAFAFFSRFCRAFFQVLKKLEKAVVWLT